MKPIRGFKGHFPPKISRNGTRIAPYSGTELEAWWVGSDLALQTNNYPLDPLGFERAQHRQTPRPSIKKVKRYWGQFANPSVLMATK